jgi:nitrate reductase NapE component
VGGVLLALAVVCKLAFAVPALAVVLSTRQRREATLTLILAVVVFAIASVAAFGVGVWREAVDAQSEVGRASLHYAGGLITQGAWNELPLVLPAAAGVRLVWTHREQPLDMELMRTFVAATLAGLLLALTVFERGSYINVLVVAEPPLLVLAAAGAVWSARRSRAASIAIGLLGVLLAAQIVSLLVHPANPPIAKRPGAQSGLAWTAGPATVDRTVDRARRCSAARAYSGNPYYAFLSDRRMPGNQPGAELLMTEHAPVDAPFARRAAADQPRCP